MLIKFHDYRTENVASTAYTTLEANTSKVGLRINKDKTKVIKVNTKRDDSITLTSGDIENVRSFTYLGSLVDETGRAQQDIKTGKSVLMYGAETLRTTKVTYRQIQSFINRCLRRILKIWWPTRIRNQDLWDRTSQLPPPLQTRKGKWTWIGHTLKKDEGNIIRQALRWNPKASGNEGDP